MPRNMATQLPTGQRASGARLKATLDSVRIPTWVRWVREFLAIAIWLCAFTHLLIVDLEQVLITAFPSIEEVLRYRLLVLLGTLASLWLLLGNGRFVVFCGYVLTYPIIVTVWIIPKRLIRNWALLVAFSPAIWALLSTAKRTFIFFSVALVSAFLVALANQPAVIIGAMAILGLYLVAHYVRRFRVAFSSSNVFVSVVSIVKKLWDRIQRSDMAKCPQGLEPESEEYKKKAGEKLLWLYGTTTLLLFLSERVREVLNSRKLDLYFVGSFCIRLR